MGIPRLCPATSMGSPGSVPLSQGTVSQGAAVLPALLVISSGKGLGFSSSRNGVQSSSGDAHVWRHLPCHRYCSGIGYLAGMMLKGVLHLQLPAPTWSEPRRLRFPHETWGLGHTNAERCCWGWPWEGEGAPGCSLPLFWLQAWSRGDVPGTEPPEPSPTVPTGVIILPYAEIREPFEAWYNLTGGKSRIEYYGGGCRKGSVPSTLRCPPPSVPGPLGAPGKPWESSPRGLGLTLVLSLSPGQVVTYQFGSIKPFGASFKVTPETTEMEVNVRRCFHINGTDRNLIAPQSVFPSLENFKVSQ